MDRQSAGNPATSAGSFVLAASSAKAWARADLAWNARERATALEQALAMEAKVGLGYVEAGAAIEAGPLLDTSWCRSVIAARDALLKARDAEIGHERSLRTALGLMESRQFEDADRLLAELAEEQPEALVWLADSRFRQGRFPEARQAAEQALASALEDGPKGRAARIRDNADARARAPLDSFASEWIDRHPLVTWLAAAPADEATVGGLYDVAAQLDRLIGGVTFRWDLVLRLPGSPSLR